MAFFLDVVPKDTRLGGKACSLAELASCGLATPSGFVLDDAVFRSLVPELPTFDHLDEQVLCRLDSLRAEVMAAPWPAGLAEELRDRLATVAGSRYSVRSSFAGEDTLNQLAPGVYLSEIDVAREDVENAIRLVLASVLQPGAVAYALARGRQPARPPVAVLIHAFVPGEAAGSAAFAPPSMTDPIVTARRGGPGKELLQQLRSAVMVLAEVHGPVEVEWVATADHPTFLQLRPFLAPLASVPWSGTSDLSPEESSQWRWDAAHNPLPLSPVQAGLVELVDHRCRIGVRQRVLGGYLFYRTDPDSLPPAIAIESAPAFFSSLRMQAEKDLAELGQEPDLEAALSSFERMYQPIFGVLQPALRETHRRIVSFLEQHTNGGAELLPALRSDVPSMATQRQECLSRIDRASSDEERASACADYLAMFGDEAPLWDVYAKTYGEDFTAIVHVAGARARADGDRRRPGKLDWAVASRQIEAELASYLVEMWHALLGLARDAVALGEADDWLYARMQAAVRRALLTVAKRLVAASRLAEISDVFYLPLQVVRDACSGTCANLPLGGIAAQGRADWEKARTDPPPSSSDGSHVNEATASGALRGFGTGGRVIGRVLWHRPGFHQDLPRDSVLAALTLLPSELPLVAPAAIVTETGGVLDHVAAQARERSIPSVVGVRGLREALDDGALVLVDADTGVVVPLGDKPTS